MRIKCKTDQCPGFVTYDASTGGNQMALMELFTNQISTKKLNREALKNEEFSDVVNTIVSARDNSFNKTKTAYLTCDNTATGPHTNAYNVPAK